MTNSTYLKKKKTMYCPVHGYRLALLDCNFLYEYDERCPKDCKLRAVWIRENEENGEVLKGDKSKNSGACPVCGMNPRKIQYIVTVIKGEVVKVKLLES